MGFCSLFYRSFFKKMHTQNQKFSAIIQFRFDCKNGNVCFASTNIQQQRLSLAMPMRQTLPHVCFQVLTQHMMWLWPRFWFETRGFYAVQCLYGRGWAIWKSCVIVTGAENPNNFDFNQISFLRCDLESKFPEPSQRKPKQITPFYSNSTRPFNCEKINFTNSSHIKTTPKSKKKKHSR